MADVLKAVEHYFSEEMTINSDLRLSEKIPKRDNNYRIKITSPQKNGIRHGEGFFMIQGTCEFLAPDEYLFLVNCRSDLSGY